MGVRPVRGGAAGPFGPGGRVYAGRIGRGDAYHAALFVSGIDTSSVLMHDPERGRWKPHPQEGRGNLVLVLGRRLKALEDRLKAHAMDASHTFSTELDAAEDPEGFRGRARKLVREDREEWERCVELWLRAVRREARRKKRREL